MIGVAIVVVLAVGGLCLYTSIKKDHEERTDPDNLDNLDEE